MQVQNLSNSIAQRYSNTATAIDEVSNESSEKREENLSLRSTLHLERARVASKIANKYGSFRNISPREMVSLSRELYDKGIISLQDYNILSHQPELHKNYNDHNEVEAKPDTKRDFIDIWKKQYMSDRSKGNFKGMEVSSGIFNILENLQSLVLTGKAAAA
ncbi:MAG: hypothetical protein GY793_08790 [Proteobacteria bacterium]|nr:hypothetical protein [Pseudomonadota bacterium]